MSKYLIPFIIVSTIIFKKVIPININLLDEINNNNLYKTDYSLTNITSFELMFRANNSDNLPFINFNKKDISVITTYKLSQYFNILHALSIFGIFDGSWHKVVYDKPNENIILEVDCSKRTSMKLMNFRDYYKPENPNSIGAEIEFHKFTLYDHHLPPSIMENCFDLFVFSLKPGDNPIMKPKKSGCDPSPTIVKGRHVCAGELIFEDDFDFFNKSKWEHEILIPSDSDDAEFVSYQDYPENCFINTGELNLKPTLLSNVPGFDENSVRMGELNLGSKCTAIIDEKIECRRKAEYFRILPPIVSAKIRTKHSFSFKYGRIDVRAKLPKGDWIFPLIHLEPLMSEYGTGSYKSGQMRIAYIRANNYLLNKNMERIDGVRLSGGVVLGVGDFIRDRWMKHFLQPNHLSDDYHLYSMIWTNESITLLLDGEKYGSIGGGFQDNQEIPHAYLWKRGEYIAPFDKEFYISLGVGAGGISDFPDDVQNTVERREKPWKNTSPKGELNFWKKRLTWLQTWSTSEVTMKIDYINVWAL